MHKLLQFFSDSSKQNAGTFLRIILAALFFGLAGCASAGKTERNVDPFEPINRPIYKFNTVADKIVFKPLAKGYDFIVPDIARTGISNFLENLRYPVVIVNGFLQGKFSQGFSDTGRFLVNSTVGIAGLFDPATPIGLESHTEDFGLTLARWGVAEGPYLVVPLFGPRTIRSGTGTLADTFVDPMVQMNNTSVRDKILITWAIDTRANLLPLDEQIEEAFDPYLFIRDAYLQNRKFLGEGEDTESDPFADEFEEDF